MIKFGTALIILGTIMIIGIVFYCVLTKVGMMEALVVMAIILITLGMFIVNMD